jgi:DNA-binding transcriptional ArsR family regulator
LLDGQYGYKIHNYTVVRYIPNNAMSLPHPIPEDLAEVIAHRLRAIAEPTRIRLIDSLRDGESCVGDLVVATGASQQNVSKHLLVLLDAGIIGRRKHGNRVFYRVVDEGVFALCEQVCGAIERQLLELSSLLEVDGHESGKRRS